MTDERLDQELKNFDFSVFSKVRTNLLDKILEKQRKDNLKNFCSFSQQIISERLSDEELDFVAAAGNNYTDKDLKKIKL